MLDDAVEIAIADAATSLSQIATERVSIIRVGAAGELDETYTALLAAIDAAPS